MSSAVRDVVTGPDRFLLATTLLYGPRNIQPPVSFTIKETPSKTTWEELVHLISIHRRHLDGNDLEITGRTVANNAFVRIAYTLSTRKGTMVFEREEEE